MYVGGADDISLRLARENFKKFGASDPLFIKYVRIPERNEYPDNDILFSILLLIQQKGIGRMHGLNWYDYSARYLDNAYGRFTTVDPMAEKYYSWSPYT